MKGMNSFSTTSVCWPLAFSVLSIERTMPRGSLKSWKTYVLVGFPRMGITTLAEIFKSFLLCIAARLER